MKTKLQSILIAILAAALPLSAQEPEHHHGAGESLGTVNFPTSCTAGAQGTFTRAVALLYSFEYELSEQEFAKVSQQDPNCAMAYWGQAMSLYHQLWERPSKETLKRGSDLLAKARKLKATQREQDYINALSVFYTDADKVDHEKRAEKYAEAMKGVSERNASDREASVFYALALLGSAPTDDQTHKNEREAVAILNKLFEQEPTHPGVAHYIIHACDNPQMADLALPAARKYASIAPDSAHAVHMPSHIFARLGLWQDDIQSNVRAIAIADKMEAGGVHVMHHKIHSMDFLEYAYLQIGDDADAKKEVDAMLNLHMQHGDMDFMHDYIAALRAGFPMVYAIERRQWKKALSLQPALDHGAEPYTLSPIYWGHAVAAGHLRDAAAAQEALKKYDEITEATAKGPKAYNADGMKKERRELVAWAAFAAGKDDEAANKLREVADEQDKVGKGETQIPAREMLADMLLESGKATEALAEYEISLKTDPNRFNGLYGAAKAATALQQKDKAAAYYSQLIKNCDGSHSDRPELEQAKMLVAAR